VRGGVFSCPARGGGEADQARGLNRGRWLSTRHNRRTRGGRGAYAKRCAAGRRGRAGLSRRHGTPALRRPAQPTATKPAQAGGWFAEGAGLSAGFAAVVAASLRAAKPRREAGGARRRSALDLRALPSCRVKPPHKQPVLALPCPALAGMAHRTDLRTRDALRAGDCAHRHAKYTGAGCSSRPAGAKAWRRAGLPRAVLAGPAPERPVRSLASAGDSLA